uniref:Uncharacterized protein n=1 Tax=Angiostrongylus cantonensis TaxID=6313 RepID=A0A0K0DC00_ANGCA
MIPTSAGWIVRKKQIVITGLPLLSTPASTIEELRRVSMPHSRDVPLRKIRLDTKMKTPYREDEQLWTIDSDHALDEDKDVKMLAE